MDLQITVIGDSKAEGEKYNFCIQLGQMLAELNAVVITGGRSGVMEAVSRGAFEAGGITVGILPGLSASEANRFCRVVIPTGMGHGRNLLTVLPADFVIAVGGQAGTLTEMGFTWIHEKPLMAVSKFGGWAGNLAGKMIDTRHMGRVTEVNTIEEIRDILLKFIRENNNDPD